MRVLVLCTGRCGSTTVATAFRHATNFTSGHETRSSMIGEERFAYPDQHIEVDNRLAWFLGDVEERFPEAHLVHLTRDRVETAASYAKRMSDTITRGSRIRADIRRMRADIRPHRLMDAFTHSIVEHPALWDDPLAACQFFVDTVTRNIESLMAKHKHTSTLRLENATEEFPAIWERIGAEGDLDAALAEFSLRYNAAR